MRGGKYPFGGVCQPAVVTARTHDGPSSARRRIGRALSAGVRGFNRNPWTAHRLELLPRDENPFYAEDGLWTHHAHTFVREPRFSRAYTRAVQAGGFDYAIRWRVHTILWAAEQAAMLDGVFVECGTGRGFMASAICNYLNWTGRPFYLFDTFQPTESPCSAYYADNPEMVADNFVEWPDVRLVVGEIPGTLPQANIDRVAFLHVDLNNAEAEEAAVRHFWPRLANGGTLIFDDYGFQTFEASRESADRLGREFGYQVLTLPTGQGLVVKRP